MLKNEKNKIKKFWNLLRAYGCLIDQMKPCWDKQADFTCSLGDFFMRGQTVTTSWWHRLWTTHVHTEKTHQRLQSYLLCGWSTHCDKRKASLHTLTLVTLFSKDPPATKERKRLDLLQNHDVGKYKFSLAGRPHQMNSLQWKQKVGWRRKVDMNLCPLTWWILRLTAPCRVLVNCLWVFSLVAAISATRPEEQFGIKRVIHSDRNRWICSSVRQFCFL